MCVCVCVRAVFFFKVFGCVADWPHRVLLMKKSVAT